MVRTNRGEHQTMDNTTPAPAEIPEQERLKIARHLYKQQRNEIEVLKFKLAAYQTLERLDQIINKHRKGSAAI